MGYRVAPPVGAWIEIETEEGLEKNIRTSLPLWERGLKYENMDHDCSAYLSLPLWERGLKYQYCVNLVISHLSLPSWERGLKSCRPSDLACGVVSLPSWERGLKSGIWRSTGSTV